MSGAVTEQAKRFNFPILNKVVLRDFSLFPRRNEIVVEFRDGVVCLAGANGVGKSTFIAAVNFGLTGRVPDPERAFESINEYYAYTETFSEDYFSGRITEFHRETAEVELDFTAGSRRFIIRRGMFEPDSLRQLSVEPPPEDSGEPTDPGPTVLHDTFTRLVAAEVGLDSFQQLTFLQLFLLTFDERRSLMFWQPRIVERVLYLAFGLDPEVARAADALRRDYDRFDSLSRNLQWQATQTKAELRRIEQHLATGESSTNRVLSEYQDLMREREAASEKALRLDTTLKDATSRLAGFSSDVLMVERQYEATFKERVSARLHLDEHPIVASSRSRGRCDVCGTEGAEAAIAERIAQGVCPLCGTAVQTRGVDDPGLDALKALDSEIIRIRDLIAEEASIIDRVSSELDSATASLNSLDKKVAEFEVANDVAGAVVRDAPTIDALRASYQLQIDSLLERKKEALRDRDHAKTEQAKLQSELNARYREAESVFVPEFRKLANAFLGLDIDVRLEPRASEVKLVLIVQNKERRLEHQLSESQRFFVDIALRMALSQYMASSAATMVIDTPEGSLDSAYESRAGEMIAQFVESGNRVLMTANINSSQLLLRLAERCGHKYMTLERMIEWADLSEVQLAEESLFDSAFKQIAERLEAGPAA